MIRSRIPNHPNRMIIPNNFSTGFTSVDVNQTFDTFVNWPERFHNTFATWLQSVGLPNIR